jgi:CubicO group peptidase (beta-lactamase class C family)/ketosteroid isomerase-like protein
MVFFLRRVALSLTLLPLSTGSAQSTRPAASTIARLVDSVATLAVAEKLAPALGVAVTMDGRTIYAKSLGMADVSAGVPANDRTLWYLASTSKSFTGFGVSLLAAQGALRFDAPITTLLPRVKWNPAVHVDSLTLANFLSHTHHINDNAVVSSAAFTGAIPEARWPELIVLADRQPTDDLIYSNFGYNVAAMVIDAIRPEGWKKYLEKNVYLPAGMRDTYTRVSGIDPKRIAMPARFLSDGRYVTEPFFKTDRTMNSAGGHLSTLHDLARWTIVQMDSGKIDGRRVFPAAAVALSHRLIAKQTRDEARRFAFFDREGWGAGWDIGSYEGEPMVSRFGSYYTTRSHLSFLPRRRIGVVAMSSGGLSALTDVIAAFVYDLEAGRSDARARLASRLDELRKRFAGAQKAIATQDSVRAARQRIPLAHPLTDFAGAYSEPSYGTVVFTVRNGHLEYRWGDMYGPVEIFDGSKSQMRIEIAGSGNVVTFEFPDSGPARSINLQGVTFRREANAPNLSDTIRKLDSAWARSYAVHDTALALALFDDEIVITSTDGLLKNREQELADIRPAAGFVMEYFRTRDQLVRVIGDEAAVVQGLAEWRFQYNGKTNEVRRRYTSVFARGGMLGWRMVALHIGRAPDG